MSRAKLLSVSLERFKSYGTVTEFELKPLTVVVGRNNSGKSTVIQALLLLKQSLKQPNSSVPLHLEGLVDALSLRELTTNWPTELTATTGPRIRLKWSAAVDVQRFLRDAKNPQREELSKHTGIQFTESQRSASVITTLDLSFGEVSGQPTLGAFHLASAPSEFSSHGVDVWGSRDANQEWIFDWSFGEERLVRSTKLEVGVDKFVPYAAIDRRNVGPRDRQRAFHNAFLLLFSEPLEDLTRALESMTYLRSIREAPPSVYRPGSGSSDEIGVSGEEAAKLLHARKTDCVHYPRPLKVEASAAHVPTQIEQRPLLDAVNDVLTELGVAGTVRIDDIRDVGFRLLFGNATLQHVGRGLTYLLPIIEYGLITDPLRWKKSDARTIDEYLAALDHFTLAAIEEPEAHLHPKVQSRLAHWLVALAMSGRRLIVETHSDHFVRRLRGIAARAAPGSALEQWIKDNVAIYMVEQGDDGMSTAKRATLTNVGRIDAWPSDFMDEATDEERAIADAALDKTPEPSTPSAFTVEHMGDEP